MPKVSVVIATYNHAHFLAEAIQSVLDQTYQDFELLVVDDGSTDDTRQVMAGFADSRLHYFYQENRGYSAARNRAIRASSGVYIALLDADDLWLAHKLEVQAAYLDRHPEVGLVHGSYYRMDKEGCILSVCRQRPPLSESVFKHLLRRNFIGTPTVVVRKRCLDQLGLFDESLRTTADWDLWLRLSRRHQISYLDQILAKYRLHDQNIHKDMERKTRNRFRILDKVFSDPELPESARELEQLAYGHAHLVIGRAYFARRQMRQARHYLIEAVKLHPSLLFTWDLVGTFLKSLLGERLVSRGSLWKWSLKRALR